jgi:hypothetical protein
MRGCELTQQRPNSVLLLQIGGVRRSRQVSYSPRRPRQLGSFRVRVTGPSGRGNASDDGVIRAGIHRRRIRCIISTTKYSESTMGVAHCIWSPTRSPCRGCQCTGGGGGASRRLGGPSHEARPTRAGRRVPARRPGHGQVLRARPGRGWKPCPKLKQDLKPELLKSKLLTGSQWQVTCQVRVR